MAFLKTLVLVGSLCALCCLVNRVSAEEELSDEEVLKWEPPSNFSARFPYHLSGYDNDGGQVWIVDVGKWDIRQIADADAKTQEDFRKYIHQMYTRCGYKSRGAEPDQESVIIIDLDGYNAEKATHLKGTLLTLDILRSFERYARRDGRGYKSGILVNANFIFESFWRAGKPLLGRVGEFIDVYGTTKAKWAPKLLKNIPRDQLPEHLGGAEGHKYLESYG
ncbi:unnamed protein product [Allacma fusca]|uniref:CRAL-TRIO domain-containing protein n=1 Tax=Allacma fusca TaxID=39272 RepID=A0A8J2P8R2_9HEXA|nr:unnamed protein product [Allacma fusca]